MKANTMRLTVLGLAILFIGCATSRGPELDHYNRGVELQKRGDYRAAVTEYDNALRIAPEFVKALSNRAAAHSALGNHRAAVADCDAALAIDPGFTMAWTNRGNARFAQGRFAEAISDYDRALQINPLQADVLVNRGIAQWKSGDASGALADYDQAIRLDRENWRAWLNRAEALRQTDSQAAIESLEEAYRYCPHGTQRDAIRGAIDRMRE